MNKKIDEEMLPKWHILLGAVFSLVLFLAFNVSPFNSLLVFLASVLIDLDHYMWYVQRKKDLSLRRAYIWAKKHMNPPKPFFHIFHTIEFLILILVLSYFFNFFLFIFIGMIFHSILDLMEMIYNKQLNGREFSSIRYFYKGKGAYF